MSQTYGLPVLTAEESAHYYPVHTVTEEPEECNCFLHAEAHSVNGGVTVQCMNCGLADEELDSDVLNTTLAKYNREHGFPLTKEQTEWI